MPGERVWVYNPTWKKGVSPKLTSQWMGPGEVLEELSDVVYRVRCVAVGGWWCYTETAWHPTAPWRPDFPTHTAHPARLHSHRRVLRVEQTVGGWGMRPHGLTGGGGLPVAIRTLLSAEDRRHSGGGQCSAGVMFVVLLYDCYWLMCSHHALRCGS